MILVISSSINIAPSGVLVVCPSLLKELVEYKKADLPSITNTSFCLCKMRKQRITYLISEDFPDPVPPNTAAVGAFSKSHVTLDEILITLGCSRNEFKSESESITNRFSGSCVNFIIRLVLVIEQSTNIQGFLLISSRTSTNLTGKLSILILFTARGTYSIISQSESI
ncbi:hypothetical protein AMHIJAGA_01009 [Lactococcus lactis]|uniref:Uncharacterized protein n=1 Tax=Lactococcus lactis TaxID=1358 RepID=A0A2X0R299_9LACT|nr:hypothetical protein AMHIJAGA_01009 [Lactococcus lactis]